MGHALLCAWLRNDLVNTIIVVDPHNKPDFNDDRIRYFQKYPSNLGAPADILVIAVKPQILKQAFESIISQIDLHTGILSIVAGSSISTLESVFGSGRSIIRSMPNTPASIGKGISVAIANKNTNAVQRHAANQLLRAAGIVEWIEDEQLMDAVTALSGSGPAYIFHLIECLAKAGENIGIEKNIAMTLARQTVIGSAALAEADAEIPAEILRKNVTSPNGTTQAGLDVLMDGKFQDILTQTLTAAQKRSKELNNA